MMQTKRRRILPVWFLMAALVVPILAQERPAAPRAGDKKPVERYRRVSVHCAHCDGGSIYAPVTLYSDRDGLGRVQGFFPEWDSEDIQSSGKYRADQEDLTQIGNDTASSISVAKGYTARLCSDEGDGEGDGVCWDFEEGQQNLPDELDNQTSFVWVRRVR